VERKEKLAKWARESYLTRIGCQLKKEFKRKRKQANFRGLLSSCLSVLVEKHQPFLMIFMFTKVRVCL
jgi:hypothetical protein